MPDFEPVWLEREKGLRLFGRYYPAKSDKPLCLCLHGLTRNSRDFEDFAPALQASGYSVLALDMRGRGQSDRDSQPERYSLPHYVDDCFAWLNHFHRRSAVWIGSSMGGGIAMAANRLDGRRVRAVLLNDIGPEVDATGIANIARIAGKGRSLTSWGDAANRCREVNGHVHPDQTSDEFWLSFAYRTHRQIAPDQFKSDYDPAILGVLSSPDSPEDRWQAFGALREKPTLLVRGALSELITREIADRMRQRFPEMTYLEVPRTGHTPLLTEESAFDAILAWLETV